MAIKVGSLLLSLYISLISDLYIFIAEVFQNTQPNADVVVVLFSSFLIGCVFKRPVNSILLELWILNRSFFKIMLCL